MKKLSKLLAASLVILVAFAGLAIGFNSIAAKEKVKEKEPGYWEATLPINYHLKDQLIFFFFTDFEAKKLHWSMVGGPGNALAVAFDVDYVKTTGSSHGPWDVKPWFDLYAEALRLKLGPSDFSGVWVEVTADKATLDADFHDPDAEGVVGTLIGHLKGHVKVLVAYPATIPLPAYENSEFTFKWTFVEPNYTVELSTHDLELPIGEPRTVTVTVKNTTILSDMVRLRVDVEDLRKKEVEVRVQYDDGLFLPTTEGVTRDVTITAFADPMKQELPITGTIRISVEGNMMFGWPDDDRAHADLTVTVPKPFIYGPWETTYYYEYVWKETMIEASVEFRGLPAGVTTGRWDFGWDTAYYSQTTTDWQQIEPNVWVRYRYTIMASGSEDDFTTDRLNSYWTFTIDLDGASPDSELYTLTYTDHLLHKYRNSPGDPFTIITDSSAIHTLSDIPPSQHFTITNYAYTIVPCSHQLYQTETQYGYGPTPP